MQKIKKSWFFENKNIINNPLAKLTKSKRTHNNKTWDEKEKYYRF